MHKNNHKLVNYDLELDKEFGKVGTPERTKVERDAYNFSCTALLFQRLKKESRSGRKNRSDIGFWYY